MDHEHDVFFTLHGALTKRYFITFTEIISSEPLQSFYTVVPVNDYPPTFKEMAKMHQYEFIYSHIMEYLHCTKPRLFQNLNRQAVEQYGFDDIVVLHE